MANKRGRDDGGDGNNSNSPQRMSSDRADGGENVKIVHLSPSLSSSPLRSRKTIQCSLPPHPPKSFASYEEYDEHYAQVHSHRCSGCGKNFPSERWLELHIAENHDPLNEAKKARGDKIYACFVEGCDKVCSTWQKRRMHLVDKHLFPRDYDFFIVNDGLGRRKTMLRPPKRKPHRRESRAHQSSSLSSSGQEAKSDGSILSKTSTNETSAPTEGGDEDDEDDEDDSDDSDDDDGESSVQIDGAATGSKADGMDDLTESMSALKFVPSSVRFGRGRGGFARR